MNKKENFKELTLKPTETILSALKKLDGINLKFQIVVDENLQILGTVTDGDIRRGLLQGLIMDANITECMNKNPIVSRGNNKFELGKKLQSTSSVFKFLPVIDKENKLRHVWVVEQKSINKTALVMAGGVGKRLGNKTKNTPKPLLKIKGRPILEVLLNKLEEANYNRIFISVHYLYEQIENFLSDYNAKSNIDLIVEKKPLGTAGSISLVPNSYRDNLTVVNGDVVTEVNFEALNDFHYERGNNITMTIAKYEHQIPFGVVNFVDNFKLISLEEKPITNQYILSGIYCLNRDVCKLVEKETIDMPKVINRARKKGMKIEIFPMYEYWKDIGNLEDFKIAEKRKS